MAIRTMGLVVLMTVFVAGCGLFGGDSSSGDVKTSNQTATSNGKYDPRYADPKDYNPKTDATNGNDSTSLMGLLFGGLGGGSGGQGGGQAGVGVNSYLWRASLDTVSFMPLASADPFGGVIITDWYSPPDQPAERFKVNVFILGRELRADGVRASVFHQTRDTAGQWTEAPVDANTATDIENAILTRARQLRLSTVTKS
ncbi:MAG TPA: DUF3576 domain-containing protein [Stellaceae bacterium]|nr:DUF3576 domain-containing protein [Stellaceae bacterium]